MLRHFQANDPHTEELRERINIALRAAMLGADVDNMVPRPKTAHHTKSKEGEPAIVRQNNDLIANCPSDTSVDSDDRRIYHTSRNGTMHRELCCKGTAVTPEYTERKITGTRFRGSVSRHNARRIGRHTMMHYYIECTTTLTMYYWTL